MSRDWWNHQQAILQNISTRGGGIPRKKSYPLLFRRSLYTGTVYMFLRILLEWLTISFYFYVIYCYSILPNYFHVKPVNAKSACNKDMKTISCYHDIQYILGKINKYNCFCHSKGYEFGWFASRNCLEAQTSPICTSILLVATYLHAEASYIERIASFDKFHNYNLALNIEHRLLQHVIENITSVCIERRSY